MEALSPAAAQGTAGTVYSGDGVESTNRTRSIITVEDVCSDDEGGNLQEEDNDDLADIDLLDDSRADSLESSMVMLSPDRKSSSSAPARMGRDAAPFFGALLLMSVLLVVLGAVTVGLGVKIELQLGKSHGEWTASLWWGGIVVFLIGAIYVFVHMTIHKSWIISKYAFLIYQLLLLISIGMLIAALQLSFSTYRSIKGVPSEQCTYANFEGTYFPLTSCYEPCRTFLYNSTGNTNPPFVCCCCQGIEGAEVVYFTSVQDCSIVDSSEARLRYLTVCYLVSLVFLIIQQLTSALLQFSCCGIVAPWHYMTLSASGRYSIN